MGPAAMDARAGASTITAPAMFLGSLLIGALALRRQDPVFIALEASSLASAAMIVLLTHRYRGMTCEAHGHARVDGRAGDGAADPDAAIPAAT
jgi:hypothetical protein